jgi:hypothetical protein
MECIGIIWLFFDYLLADVFGLGGIPRLKKLKGCLERAADIQITSFFYHGESQTERWPSRPCRPPHNDSPFQIFIARQTEIRTWRSRCFLFGVIASDHRERRNPADFL